MKKFSALFFTLMGFNMAQTASGAQPVLLYERDTSLLTTVVQVVVRSGALSDPEGKTGVSQMMGELMLRGTKKQKRSAFQSEIERLGGAISVRTQHDLTLFVGRVISENTMDFLKLLGEALVTPAFEEKEFKALQTEQLAEIAFAKNSNNRLGGLALRREFFKGTPLERPTMGTMSSVSTIKRDDIIKSYNDAFSQPNIVFSVASPMAEKDIKAVLTDIWSKFPDGARRAYRNIEPKIPTKPTIILIHKPDTSTGSLAMGQMGILAQDPDRYTLSVGNFSFGGEPLVCRLFRTIRSELGWTYYIGSSYTAMGALSYQRGMFLISATPSVEFTTKTIRKTLELWDDYLSSGVKDTELELSRESYVNSYPFEFDSAEKRLWQKLYSYLYEVPLLNPEQYATKINAISDSDVKKALKGHHDTSKWLIALVADKNVIEKQLDEEQKDVPEDKRLRISKVITPDSLVE